MAKQEVNIGVEGNDGTGDSIRESFRKVNENFTELYAVFGQGGTIRFTNLSDTPTELVPNTIPLVNDAGTFVNLVELASNSAVDENLSDTITFTYNIDGKLVISTAFTQLADDQSPSLGGPLNAAAKGVGGVAITTEAAEDINNEHGTTYTIDDLVITKGYADRRYITTGLPIRVADEPATVTQYTLTIDRYINGFIEIVDHGLDSGVNGTPYTFRAEDTDPSGLTTGEQYFIRYRSPSLFSVHTSQADAQEESNAVAETTMINVTGTIAVDDTHSITDSAYDDDLFGNFLDDVAIPRKSAVRRQGDDMEGALYLHDHPGDLSGEGAPNGIEDFQAATKYYVDNTSYSSPTNLFVSTSGDDSMGGVPNGKEGTSFTYAYRSINAAAARAEEIIKTSGLEPGPYFQTITKDSQSADAPVVEADVLTPVFEQARLLIEENREYIIKEVSGYIAFTYPNFTYNVETCERDTGLILDAIAFDINRGQNANYLSRIAAESYYSNSSGRLAITTQLTETVDSINFARDLVTAILTNDLYQQKNINSITKASIPVVTTSTNHGLSNKNQIIFKNVGGMVQINDQTAYVKVITDQTFELYTDVDLTTPFDNSSFDNYTTGGNIGTIYQTDEEQYIGVSDAAANAITGVTDKFNLITNIMQNGIDAGEDIVYGSTYQIVVDNGSLLYIDQGNPDNTDTLPGKIIRGKISGATAEIVSLTNNDAGNGGNDVFQTNLLKPIDFVENEPLEYGNFVRSKQVTIFVESGIYEEDYPIRLSNNVSVKGDEFRRVIIRPKRRVSQSKWADLYFFRDQYFDGLTLTSAGSPFFNQVGDLQGYFGRHYLTDPTLPRDTGGTVNNPGGYEVAADILDRNKEFIQEEVIYYINNTLSPAFVYNEAKCRRDTGLIIDAIVNDITKGNQEATLEAQGEYYSNYISQFNNNGFAGQEATTEAAIQYISTLAASLLIGVAPVQNNATEEPDVSLGVAHSAWAADVNYEKNVIVLSGGNYYRSVLPHKSISVADLNNSQLWTAVDSPTIVVGNLVDLVTYAFDADYNPPKRNDEMDVFLMSDATICRNVTVQGHGGFMCVLDPEGQVLTKSPYIQTASSFSKSINAKAFRGGMYVDAYVGNLPITIDTKINAFQLEVSSSAGQGLFIRPPELPCPFYVDGRRYQVNAISDYDSGLGTATIYLDADSNGGDGYDETQFDTDPGVVQRDVFLQTAGNRSMLANDFTQINDLGYGLITNNGAFSEQVSTFTYYCQAAFYANNGSEIRSLNGSNGYGRFGLVAEGADPNEVPDQVILKNPQMQPIKAFTDSVYTNAFDEPSITVTDCKVAPTSNSLITIDHGGVTGVLNYVISGVTNLSDQDGDGILGTGADPVVSGVDTVFNISGADASRTPGTYEDVQQSGTTGSGSGARFTIIIDGGGAAVVTKTRSGEGYVPNETLTIAASSIGGTGSNLTFSVQNTFGGTMTNVFNNKIYKLDLKADDVLADDFFGTLQATVTNETLIEFRHNQNMIFDNVNEAEQLVTRPSTAINFDESDEITYRSISFQPTDDVQVDLASDEILTTFEANFEFVELQVDTTRLTGGYGSAQGDTRIAFQKGEITADTLTRLTRDVAGRQPGDAGYSNGMQFTWQGKTHEVTSVVDNTTWIEVNFADVASTNISGYGGSGLSTAINTDSRSFFFGLMPSSTAEITIAISLLRATGHDFTQIGTGSFNDSNYPNVLLGDPENSLAEFYTDSATATTGQVWERRKGRVFWVSTDQFGFFRVGKFFNVDQATGDITFAGEIGLSNANSLGFKKGVTINEFSADDSFADDSGQAVPTEKAIGSYLSRRLGYNIAGAQVQPSPSGNRIGPGFLPLNGQVRWKVLLIWVVSKLKTWQLLLTYQMQLIKHM